MSDQDDIFRISIRFNKHEYSDVDQYLSRFTGANKGAHIRMLIRLGIQAMTGRPIAVTPGHSLPTGLPAPSSAEQSAKNRPGESVTSQPIASAPPIPGSGAETLNASDVLLDMGINPTDFQFGAAR